MGHVAMGSHQQWMMDRHHLTIMGYQCIVWFGALLSLSTSSWWEFSHQSSKALSLVRRIIATSWRRRVKCKHRAADSGITVHVEYWKVDLTTTLSHKYCKFGWVINQWHGSLSPTTKGKHYDRILSCRSNVTPPPPHTHTHTRHINYMTKNHL